VPENCRHVRVDALDTDWLAVKGAAADPKHRLRVERAEDGSYRGLYVGGFFKKVVLRGEVRDDDVKFTEVDGGADKVRLYVKPNIKKCALQVFAGTVDANGKEKVPAQGVEFVVFPQQDGVEFTYEPPDRTLFVAAAAKDKSVADKQIADAGQADPQAEFPDVPVGMWSKVAEDGDESCKYDMDLYLDDQAVPDLRAVPAGEVKDGYRQWYHEWKVPYSGNHNLEFHRYRTCSGGQRQLIDIAAIESVLM